MSLKQDTSIMDPFDNYNYTQYGSLERKDGSIKTPSSCMGIDKELQILLSNTQIESAESVTNFLLQGAKLIVAAKNNRDRERVSIPKDELINYERYIIYISTIIGDFALNKTIYFLDLYLKGNDNKDDTTPVDLAWNNLCYINSLRLSHLLDDDFVKNKLDKVYYKIQAIYDKVNNIEIPFVNGHRPPEHYFRPYPELKLKSIQEQKKQLEFYLSFNKTLDELEKFYYKDYKGTELEYIVDEKFFIQCKTKNDYKRYITLFDQGLHYGLAKRRATWPKIFWFLFN